MVRITNQEIAPEDKIDYSHNLKFAKRFGQQSVRTRGFFNKRKRLHKLIEQSPITALAKKWQSLSDLEKSAWVTAGGNSNMVGYKLFTQDYALREQNSKLPITLPFNVFGTGAVAPSNFWQGLVGHINISDGLDEYHVQDDHTPTYKILRKVFDSRNMFEPVEITETATVPIDIKFNYKSKLTDDEGGGFCLLQIGLRGGTPPNNFLDFVFVFLDLNSNWKEQLASVTTLPLGFEYYTLEFIFWGVSGDFWFDDFSVRHSGLEWTKDLKCERVNEHFLNEQYDFFPSWNDVDPRAGFGSESIFPLSD